jgi:cell division protease FtsH
VRYFGMFGEDVSYISRDNRNTSDEHNAQVDMEVKRILDESFKRVEKLLLEKDKELRNLAKGLFLHDYLDADEMDRIISGRELDPEKSKKVRDWQGEEYLIKFK